MLVNVYGFILLLISVLGMGIGIGMLIGLKVVEKDVKRLSELARRASKHGLTLIEQNDALIRWAQDIPYPCTEEAMNAHLRKLTDMLCQFNADMEENTDDQD